MGTGATLTNSQPVSQPVSQPMAWIDVGRTPICAFRGLYKPGRVLSVQGY